MTYQHPPTDRRTVGLIGYLVHFQWPTRTAYSETAATRVLHWSAGSAAPGYPQPSPPSPTSSICASRRTALTRLQVLLQGLQGVPKSLILVRYLTGFAPILQCFFLTWMEGFLEQFFAPFSLYLSLSCSLDRLIAITTCLYCRIWDILGQYDYRLWGNFERARGGHHLAKLPPGKSSHLWK